MQTNDENAIFTLSGFPCAQTLFTHAYFAPNIFIIYRTCGRSFWLLSQLYRRIHGASVLLGEPNGILMPTLFQCWRSSQWKIIVQVCGKMFAKVIRKFSVRGRWRFVVATTPSTALRNNKLRMCVTARCAMDSGDRPVGSNVYLNGKAKPC